ncbi:MAG: exopolysaccharide biosynthesis polyprenyl glycosylphosphotransferase [Pirellula sp.]|jgi:Undecaprenyl-phosphate galactose phosphotransferase WbaP
MSLAAEPLVEERPFSDATQDIRYIRLDSLDRHSASSLHKYCQSNLRSNELATRLANLSNVQSLLTALPLMFADIVGLTCCFMTGMLLVALAIPSGNALLANPEFFALLSLIILPIGRLAGLYPGLGQGSVMEFRQLAKALIAAHMVFAGIGWFAFAEHRFAFLLVCGFVFSISLPSTMTLRFICRHLAKRFSCWGVPTLILAEPGRGYELFRRMKKEVEQGYRPVGLLLEPEDYWIASQSGVTSDVPIYDIRAVDEVAASKKITWVIVSPCAKREVAPVLDHSLAPIPNKILLSSNALDLSIWDHMFCVGSTTGVRFGGGHPGTPKLIAKRLLDIGLTSLALIGSFPFLVVLCIWIKLGSKGPIFYSQKRVGLGGKEFRAWKFRTMQPNADKVLDDYLATHPEAKEEWDKTHKLGDDPRVTKVGKLLRATSIDELPQLWNVLRGEMSLVGPRPIIDSPTYDACYIRDYPDEYRAYTSVRPGLTGLWQVRCRNSGVYELRIYWDMYYIRNWCIWLDMYLIMRTVKTVLMREGS